MKPLATIIKLGVACAAMAFHPAWAARVALVIGNSAYTSGPLKNPVNDARAMDQKLSSLGFKVQRVENLKRQQIGRTLTAFANTIAPGDEVVVFYAGHGVQVKGVNYLPAVDADIQSEEDVPLNSLNLNSLMDRLDEAKAGLKILFLDACRNNPYSRGFRSGDRGLARIGTAPSGTLIHYATRPGSVAADGNGANGLYTSQLLKHLDAANIPVEAVLKRVSAAVEAASSGQQEPWTEGSIKGEFYFRGGAGPATQVASLEPQPIAAQVPGRKPGQSQPEAAPTLVADPAETAYWAEVVKSQSEADLKAYLQAYPNGAYVQKAQQLLEQQQVQKRQQEQAKEDQAWANAQQANDYNSYNNFTGQYPNSRYTPLAKLKASKLQGQTVQDCSECPKMVVIPSGSFTMGSSNGASNEKPPHQVSVKSYLLGQTLVTQGQWKAIMGSNPSRFAACGDTCPVENINWKEAQAFATALSQKTGKNYRLPSEAEWEYAARAGTNTKWSFGDNESELGQYAWYSANSNDQTHPVAQKKPNAWGLYDMHGNAWEWVQDVHHDSYSGAPTDGGAWTSGGDQARRVLRGGSWNDYPGDLRSAYRNWYTPDFRNTNLGLRIARTL